MQAPNQDALCFRDEFEEWETKYHCKVVTSTRDTFQEMFDNDDTLAYEPVSTAAIILTGGDDEAEAAALEVRQPASCLAPVHKAALKMWPPGRTVQTGVMHHAWCTCTATHRMLLIGVQVCKEAEIEEIAIDSREQVLCVYLTKGSEGPIKSDKTDKKKDAE